jgi:hypothetical protein
MAYFNLHKEAMSFYGGFKVVAQLVWILLSVQYLSSLIVQKAPFVEGYQYPIGFVVLIFLHYMLHELLKYVFYNKLDDDPNTVNDPIHYIICATILAGLVSLDVCGAHDYFRQDEKFAVMSSTNNEAYNRDKQQRLDVYNHDLATLNSSYSTELTALKGTYESQIRKIKGRKTYDEFDIKKRNRDVAAVKGELDLKISERQQAQASEQRTLLAAKNTDLATLAKKHGEKDTSIAQADTADAANAKSNSWIVSIFLLLVILGCTYQSTKLRVGAGQKPVGRYTVSDATGGAISKTYDVVTDIVEKRYHIGLARFHEAYTPRELDALDGSFTLKGVNYSKTEEEPTHSTTKVPEPPQLKKIPLPTVIDIVKFNKTIQGIQTALATENPAKIDITAWKDALYDLNPRIVFFDSGLVMVHNEDYKEVEALAIQYMNAEKKTVEVTEKHMVFDWTHYHDLDQFWKKEIKEVLANKFKITEEHMAYALNEANANFRGYSDNSFDYNEPGAAAINFAIMFYKPTTPFSEVTPTQTDDAVITDKSVITGVTTVITDESEKSNPEFEYGNTLLKTLKREAQVEVSNWRSHNGTPKAIRDRCKSKTKDLDRIILDCKVSSAVRQDVCNYFADFIAPISLSTIEKWDKELVK